MRRLLFLLPFVALAACGGPSIDAEENLPAKASGGPDATFWPTQTVPFEVRAPETAPEVTEAPTTAARPTTTTAAPTTTLPPTTTVAPTTLPPTTVASGPNVVGAANFVETFVGNIQPNLMAVCPLVRSNPDLVQAGMRSSLNQDVIYERAAGFGYSNEEFVEMLVIAYSNRLVTDCS